MLEGKSMIYLLKLLIFGHIHQWEIHREVRLEDANGDRGSRYILRCKNCGEIKHKDCI